MLIYNYSKTGEFICNSEAIESPLETGVFLIPAYATDTVPPTLTENQCALFSNGAWSTTPDYRGQNGCEIDANSIYLQAHNFVLGESPSATLILSDVPNTDFHKSKWDGTKWIEGLTQEEIDIINNTPVPKTDFELVQEQIDKNQKAIDFILQNY